MSRSLCFYLAGDKKKDPIPDFFKSATHQHIEKLRKELSDKQTLKQLQELTVDPKNFASQVQDPKLQDAFNKLKNIASEEMQGGLFINKCWSQAVDNLSLGRMKT